MSHNEKDGSRLAGFIREYLRKNDLTMLALEKRLTNSGYASEGFVSRIVRGHMQPNDKFLSALAAESQTPFDDLKSWASESIHEERVQFSIAAGNSIWNCPFLVPLLENQVPGLKLASRSRIQENEAQISHNDLCWIPTTSVRDGDDPEFDGEKKPLTSLSADDVLGLLRREEVDLGALPGQLADRGEFIHLATTVDSSQGCSIVFRIPEGWDTSAFDEIGSSVSVTEFVRALANSAMIRQRDISQPAMHFYLAFEKGTISALIFDLMKKEFTELEKRSETSFVLEPLHFEHRNVLGSTEYFFESRPRSTSRVNFSRSRREEYDAARERFSFLGFISWEPHSSVLKSMMLRAEGCCTDRIRKTQVQATNRNFTFSLVMQRKRKRLPDKKALLGLVAELIDRSSIVASALEQHNTEAFAVQWKDRIEVLSKYYCLSESGFSEQEIHELFRSQSFNVHPTTEFLNEYIEAHAN